MIRELTDKLVEKVEQLNKTVDIAPSFREHGVTDEKFNSNIDFVAQQAFGDPCTGSNPRQTSPEDLKRS